jgi:PCI domain
VLHGLCDLERLVPAHCEFLDACIFAQEYQLAESHILQSWPRPQKGPHAINIETVLRYYYLRGVVHLNCGPSSYSMAMRCFWTCLSVPATSDTNVVSAIAVNAWKKLILVQSLQYCECLSDSTVLVSYSGSEIFKPKLVANAGSSSASPQSSFDPLSTPKEMSSGIARFLSLAKAPRGNQSASSEPSQSPISSPTLRSPVGPAAPEVVHFVEAETENNHGNDNGENNLSNRPERYSSMGVYVYKELIKAYVEADRVAFDEVVREHGALLRDDGNFGLVRRVGAALLFRQVYELSHVYAAVSIAQLSSELGMSIAEVQSLLERLRADKRWAVELRQDGTVVFPNAPPSGPQSIDAKATAAELGGLAQMVRLINGTLSKPAGGRGNKDFKTDMSGSPPRGVGDF